MDENVVMYQQKLAELVRDVPIEDGEVQEKFAEVYMGGLIAGRELDATIHEYAQVPLVADSLAIVANAIEGA